MGDKVQLGDFTSAGASGVSRHRIPCGPGLLLHKLIWHGVAAASPPHAFWQQLVPRSTSPIEFFVKQRKLPRPGAEVTQGVDGVVNSRPLPLGSGEVSSTSKPPRPISSH